MASFACQNLQALHLLIKEALRENKLTEACGYLSEFKSVYLRCYGTENDFFKRLSVADADQFEQLIGQPNHLRARVGLLELMAADPRQRCRY